MNLRVKGSPAADRLRIFKIFNRLACLAAKQSQAANVTTYEQPRDYTRQMLHLTKEMKRKGITHGCHDARLVSQIVDQLVELICRLYKKYIFKVISQVDSTIRAFRVYCETVSLLSLNILFTLTAFSSPRSLTQNSLPCASLMKAFGGTMFLSFRLYPLPKQSLSQHKYCCSHENAKRKL